MQDFARSYFGASKKCLQGALESLQVTDRSFCAAAVPACQSDFSKVALPLLPLEDSELSFLPVAELVAFFEEAASWVKACMTAMTFDNRDVEVSEVLRVENFGSPAWSPRVQGILPRHTSHSLLTSWGMQTLSANDASSIGAGLQQPNMATSQVAISHPVSPTSPGASAHAAAVPSLAPVNH
jgi:hypothetical protein